jgi:hypothetical protein
VIPDDDEAIGRIIIGLALRHPARPLCAASGLIERALACFAGKGPAPARANLAHQQRIPGPIARFRGGIQTRCGMARPLQADITALAFRITQPRRLRWAAKQVLV